MAFGENKIYNRDMAKAEMNVRNFANGMENCKWYDGAWPSQLERQNNAAYTTNYVDNSMVENQKYCKIMQVHNTAADVSVKIINHDCRPSQ